MTWCHKCLIKVGILVLIKVVLEAIPILWTIVTTTPRGILNMIRKISYIFFKGKCRQGILFFVWHDT